MVSRREQIDYVLGLGASEVVVIAKGDPAVLPASSVDAVLDTVAGQLFPGLIGALRDGGVLSLVGAVGGGDVTFDAWNLIRPVTVTGYSSESLTGQDLRTAIAALGDGLRRASIRPPRFDVVPLQEAAEAHRRLAAGGTTGRLLLQPAGSSI